MYPSVIYFNMAIFDTTLSNGGIFVVLFGIDISKFSEK